MSENNNLCIGSCDPGGSGAIGFAFKAYPRTISVEDTPTVAGEIGDSFQENRPVDWTSPCLASDIAVVQRVTGLKDFKRSAQFQLAIERAEKILRTHSCALASLTIRLRREPFQILAEEFSTLMERMNVRQEI